MIYYGKTFRKRKIKTLLSLGSEVTDNFHFIFYTSLPIFFNKLINQFILKIEIKPGQLG